MSPFAVSPFASLDLPGLDTARELVYELVLYVAGAAPRSESARRNLAAICQQYLAGRHTLTVVDLHQKPEKAGEDEILGVPCLVNKQPGLVRRLVGDLSDRDRVLKVALVKSLVQMLHLLVSCLTQKVAFIKSALRTYFLTHENGLNPLV